MVIVELKYSQNALRSFDLIEKLLDSSLIKPDDTVLEIGAGKGIITAGLAKHCKLVIAVEIDKDLVAQLRQKFGQLRNVKICEANFLAFPLPKGEYKIFSNIPFAITADIIRKITKIDTAPVISYLVVQKEAAQKFSGCPYGKETLFSVLNKPLFDFSIVHEFLRSDFVPVPRVGIVLLRITKLEKPLVDLKQMGFYRDFITYGFGSFRPTLRKGYKHIFSNAQFSKLAKDLGFSVDANPRDLVFEQWLKMFAFFLIGVEEKRRLLVRGSFERLSRQQEKLEKIHRTRITGR